MRILKKAGRLLAAFSFTILMASQTTGVMA